MALTTPPRPYDILELFPALTGLARPAVRLHPRPGRPGVHDSSVAGPLLWPAEEPWPVCVLEHEDVSDEEFDHIVALRDHVQDPDRRAARSERVDMGTERRRMHELELEHTLDDYPGDDETAPQPLIPVAQLYYRDVPGLPFADRFDLLQILWCPRDHPDTETPYNPEFQLRWRRTSAINGLLLDPPRPVVASSSYVPNTCVVQPETVTEYPQTVLLPEPLRESMSIWEERTGNGYTWDAALAPGWKTMGHGGYWGIYDPYPMLCECGTEQLPLLTAASGEFDGGTQSWQPIEEAGTGWALADPVEVTIGRGYTLQLYYCPESKEHANRAEMF
jgi:hypothetical protein